jgi:hypothetical protein
MILFCFRFRDSRRLFDLIWGSVFMGISAATTSTQLIFSTFLIWACWTQPVRSFLIRYLSSLAIVAVVFLIFNPTIPFHFDDYTNEIRFLSNWYPFKIRFGAIPEYLFFTVRPALGNILFTGSLISMGIYFWSEKSKRKNDWLYFLAISFLIGVFQLQSVAKDPLQIRPYLVILSFLSFFTVAATFEIPYGRFIRWGLLSILIGHGILYGLHFNSDKIPSDNATLASLWIKTNIPKNSVIQHMYNIITVDQFPPIPFHDYRFLAYKPEVQGDPGSYFVFNSSSFQIDDELKSKGYALVARFENSPLQKLGMDDKFTNANFPIRIYKKD